MAARYAVAFAFLLVAVFMVWRRHHVVPNVQAPAAIVPVGTLRIISPGLQAQIEDAEAAFRNNPNDAAAIRGLAHIYAVAIANRDVRYEEHAMAQLAASDNVWLVGNAAHSLQHLHNQTLQYGRPDQRMADLAERYFLRAKTFDPSLDRAKILPQIDLDEIRREREETERKVAEFQERFARAEREIVRLPIDEFPELPLPIAEVLRSKGCTIPQAYDYAKTKHNVIRGEFFRRGEEGWAVLCSVSGSSMILIFRNDQDIQPDEIHQAEDLHYMQVVAEDNQVGFSRVISTVDRGQILPRLEPLDGAKPPPIRHHGIEDAFSGKGSGISYFHAGNWINLPVNGC